jgi:hypothetical protein
MQCQEESFRLYPPRPPTPTPTPCQALQLTPLSLWYVSMGTSDGLGGARFVLGGPGPLWMGASDIPKTSLMATRLQAAGASGLSVHWQVLDMPHTSHRTQQPQPSNQGHPDRGGTKKVLRGSL